MSNILNKKKIIIFNPSIEDGGVEKNLYIITNYLANNNFKVDLISSDLSKKNRFVAGVNFIHSNLFVKKNSGRYIKYFSCLITLIGRILECKQSIVLSFQANIYTIIVCYLFGIKVIARLNTAPQGWDHNFIKSKIYSFFIKRANTTIVNSVKFKSIVKSRYNLNSVLIHNPFEFKKIEKLSNYSVKYNFNNDKINLINVGRLTDQKDQMTLIKSLTKIRNKKKIHLTIIGKGQNEHKLKKYVKENNLKSIVSFLGYKINPFPYIKKADVFVLSSRYEGSPNVLIEAQFLNKYIISTDCPTGPREILKYYKNSKLFKIGNSMKLADIIDNLKKNKKTTRTNFFHGLHKYKVENNCRDYVKVIQNLI